MNLYSLKNTTTSDVHEFVGFDPSKTAIDVSQRPAKKADYKTCDWHFVSAISGENPARRVDKNDNPAKKIHGLVLEYDAVQPERWLEHLRSSKFELRPRWAVTTLSGNARLVFEFERPVPCAGEAWWRKFHARLIRELRATHMGANLQPLESERMTYFELGSKWDDVGGDPLPAAWLSGIAVKAAEQTLANSRADLPIEVLRDELTAKFPDVGIEWDRMNYGDRTRRWWDETSDNDTGCILFPSGVYSFTDDRAFRPWRELVGSAVVDRHDAERIGRATENIWNRKESNSYYVIEGDRVKTLLKPDTRTVLSERGLRPRAGKDELVAEVDRALLFIAKERSLLGEFPFLYNPEKIVEYEGDQFLNTSTVKPLPPASRRVTEWGDGFPTLAKYLEELFGGVQLPHFKHWLWHAFKGALNGELRRGLALFICGPPGCGKTYLNTVILGRLFGGSEDAEKFLSSTDQFNDTLFRRAIWTVDDNTSTDPRTKSRFSAMVKALVSNDKVSVRGMHRSRHTKEWTGRVCVTLNSESKSLASIPESDASILSKFLLLRAFNAEKHVIPCHAGEAPEKLLKELEHLAAYLRDFEPDPAMIYTIDGREHRFGIEPYHDPDLLSESRSLEDVGQLEDHLRDFAGQSDEPKVRKTFTEWKSALEGVNYQANHSLATLMRSLGDAPDTPWWSRKRIKGRQLYELDIPMLHECDREEGERREDREKQRDLSVPF